MATRNRKPGSPLVLLLPFVGVLMAAGNGCAGGGSTRQPEAAASIPFAAVSMSSAQARACALGPRATSCALPALCPPGNLDLPTRLDCSESLSADCSPTGSVAAQGDGNPCPESGNCEGVLVIPPSEQFFPGESSHAAHFGDRCRELCGAACCDWKNFYSCSGMRDLLLGVGVAAVLANTSLDQDFRDWYQERVRTRDTDRFAEFWNHAGQGLYVVPCVAGVAVVGALCDDTAAGSLLADFGGRASRAYLVGAPPMLFGQWALGGARPGESDLDSQWSPFQDSHAISGHAFVGAVPFITAAKMADCPWLKAGLYGLSLLPAWARVNDDKHYLSQAALGWWIAYLSCAAADTTDRCRRPYTFAPLWSPDAVGVNAMYQW